jgi:hypothetical protein
MNDAAKGGKGRKQGKMNEERKRRDGQLEFIIEK